MSGVTGGCLRKVDSQTLTSLLAAAGIEASARAAFLDAENRQLPDGSTSLATTTDLVYDFGAAPRDFGWIAAAHALSDLFAVLAKPVVATICLGVTRSAVTDGTSAATLRGFLEAISAESVALGGGHTVYADANFVSVSAVGVNSITPAPAWTAGETYTLLVSKALGSGIYLSARANGLLDQSAYEDELLPLLRTSNARAARGLRELALAEPGSLAFVTDVTGFGLLLGVGSKLRHGASAVVKAADVPLLGQVGRLISEEGLATALGEQNMFALAEDPVFALGTVPVETQLALSDPQTSGGLVTAVRASAAEALLVREPGIWAAIGTVQMSEQPSPPRLKVA